MRRKRFWKGFMAGAAAGAGGAMAIVSAVNAIGNRGKRQIVRIEKALQIGRPTEEVFHSWANLQWLANASDVIEEIQVEGNRSHWTLRIDGRRVRWDAEVEQFIPNRAIGWKSVNGPKHTGRITFSPLENNTLVQVTMNYAPPMRFFGPFTRQLKWPLDSLVDKTLRDFKAALEGKGQEGRKPPVRSDTGRIGSGPEMTQNDLERATGTFGRPSEVTESRLGDRWNPVDYTSPPEAKR